MKRRTLLCFELVQLSAKNHSAKARYFVKKGLNFVNNRINGGQKHLLWAREAHPPNRKESQIRHVWIRLSKCMNRFHLFKDLKISWKHDHPHLHELWIHQSYSIFSQNDGLDSKVKIVSRNRCRAFSLALFWGF